MQCATVSALDFKQNIGFLPITQKQFEIEFSCKKTFSTHYLRHFNPEGEGSSYKIGGFMANYISELKWVWQAQLLSHALPILKNNVFLKIDK